MNRPVQIGDDSVRVHARLERARPPMIFLGGAAHRARAVKRRCENTPGVVSFACWLAPMAVFGGWVGHRGGGGTAPGSRFPLARVRARDPGKLHKPSRP